MVQCDYCVPHPLDDTIYPSLDLNPALVAAIYQRQLDVAKKIVAIGEVFSKNSSNSYFFAFLGNFLENFCGLCDQPIKSPQKCF